MKILLITHPFFDKEKLMPYVPIGLLSLATVMKNRGYTPVVHDLNYARGLSELAPSVLNAVEKHKPDVTGMTTVCHSYHITLGIARQLRNFYPEMPLLLGGPQASATAIETMRLFPFIDAIVRYEAEGVICDVLSDLGDVSRLANIPGLVIRHNGELIANSPQHLIDDLDKIPITDYSFYERLSEHKNIPIEVGRGCPFGCTFCSTTQYWFRKFRLYKLSRLIQQVEDLYEQGFRKFRLVHDIMTLDRKWTENFCRLLLKTGLGIEWSCSSRANCLDKELIELMHVAGCTSIFIGIETGSLRMQKLTNKKLPLEDLVGTVRLLETHRIKTTVSFILGFPEEKSKDVKLTLNMILEMICSNNASDQVQIHRLSPLAGSKLFEKFRDSLIFNGFDVASTFAMPLDHDEAFLVKRHPDVFSSYYRFNHPEMRNDFLTALILFARNWVSFPFTSFVFWKHDCLKMLDKVFQHPEALVPLVKIDSPDVPYIEFIQAIKEVFYNIYQTAHKAVPWVKAVLNYEVAVNLVREKAVSETNPKVVVLEYDPETILNEISGYRQGPWKLPCNIPDENQLAYILWKEEGGIRLKKVFGPLADLFRRINPLSCTMDGTEIRTSSGSL